MGCISFRVKVIATQGCDRQPVALRCLRSPTRSTMLVHLTELLIEVGIVHQHLKRRSPRVLRAMPP
ncbi:hypothetical protein [Scytonema sp. HK-05]|uniref:hypothetical protein n=1 Tax=Scytonema sp. HK-05 TaxID=1137095 RepID=UPI000B2A1B34|nr:hypothetical protein [Scytonema sp. HK-05]